MNRQDQSQISSTLKPQNNNINFQQETHPKDFSSVQRYVTLPRLRKIQPGSNVFLPVEKELKDSDLISSQLKQTMIELRQKLRNEFSTFSNVKDFDFSFPESKFPSVQPGTRNLITYEQKNIVQEQDTFRDRLQPQQIQQIRENGQFKVRSNHQYITLPYVWKVNDTLFRGRRNVEVAWFKTLAKAHSVYCNALRRVKQQIPKELNKIKNIPSKIFSLLFGKRSMRTTYEVNCDHQVGKDFWDQVMTKYYVKSKQWSSDLWQYFDVGYKAQDFMTIRQIKSQEQMNEQQTQEYNKKQQEKSKSVKKYNQRLKLNSDKKQKILSISHQFQQNWMKKRKKVFQEVSNEVTNQKDEKKNNEQTSNQLQELIKKKEKQNEQQIIQKLNDRKFEHYTSFLQKKLPKAQVPQKIIEAIITILTLMQITTKKQRKYRTKIEQQRTKLSQQIKSQHKIKQYNYIWYNLQVARLFQPIQKKLEIQYLNKFIDIDLIKRLNMKQKEVYNLWLQYRTTYSARIQAKKRQIQPLQQPQRIFYSTYHLFPPYKVIQHESKSYNNLTVWYEMIKQGKMQITTQKNFWKLDLYIMRVKSWTINCIVFLVYSCWKGTFGLRCFWGMTQFRYDQYIDYNSGQIYNQYRKPVLHVFQDVLSGIRKNREYFESLPDRGLFGKNFSRIFNYIECYVFRLFFVGIIITLILYPISIVLFSLIQGILIITVWAWMPFVLMVTYVFNILFFQFQSSWIPYGFFVRFSPLPSLCLLFILSILKIIFLFIFSAILSPLGIFFICLYACLERGFKTGTDAIMLFLIRKLGRTPSRNTAIAKKISGPGMSKQYYMSINQQDVYILVQSQLEQIFMGQYNRIFSQQIEKPVQTFTKVMQLLLKPLQSPNQAYYGNYSYSNPQQKNVIVESVNQLRTKYYNQYNNYMNRYPQRPYNVRFTQQQIDSYFDNTVSIVKSFVQKKQIKSWIFEEEHILQDYEQLTRKIWMRVFNCGQQIFEPLQKIDQRFKLQDMYKNDYDQSSSSFGNASMKRNVHKVMQALEGEIVLKPRRANITAYKHSLINKELSSSGIQQVFTLMENNSEGRVYFQTNAPRFLFYPNLSIKQIIKKDQHEYKWRKQENQKNRESWRNINVHFS